MKKLVMLVALLASASISAMADDIVNSVALPSSKPNVATPMDAQPQLLLGELPHTPTPLSWTLIRSVAGPNIPSGWQIVGVEGVLLNGSSINRYQVYLYNPTTRATAGWLIQIN